MAKNKCVICNNDIGLISYKIEFPNGNYVCKDCATKSGVINTTDLTGITVDMIRNWVESPENCRTFLSERKQLAEERRREKEIQREAARKFEEKKKQEQDKKREEMIAVAKEKAAERERERFPNGRVHVTIEQVSYSEIGAVIGSGNTLDAKLQKMQDKGYQIMDVTCYSSGANNNYVQAVIVYRIPNEV